MFFAIAMSAAILYQGPTFAAGGMECRHWVFDEGEVSDRTLITESECSSVDLTARLGAPRKQGSFGWCGFHTMADLLDYQLSGTHSQGQVSAEFLAINYYRNQKMPLDPQQGSNLPELFKMTVQGDRGGVCFKPISDRFFGDNEIRNSLRLGRFLSIREGVRSAGFEWMKVFKVKDPLKVPLRQLDQGDIESFIDGVYMDSLDVKEIPRRELLAQLWLLDDEQFKDWLLSLVCAEKKWIFPDAELQLKTVYGMDYSIVDRATMTCRLIPKNLSKEILQQLDLNNIVAFTYSAKMASLSTSEHHASSIVGRQWRKDSSGAGSCHFLVRNTWNLPCEKYAPTVSACDAPPGHFWVSEKNLKEHVTSVNYIEPAPRPQASLVEVPIVSQFSKPQKRK